MIKAPQNRFARWLLYVGVILLFMGIIIRAPIVTPTWVIVGAVSIVLGLILTIIENSGSKKKL